MKIIITENQNYILRRLHQFIEIVEEQIEGYELNENNAWWCRRYNPNSFLENFIDRSIEEFVNQNWGFFQDESEQGGLFMDISILIKIVEKDYGNHIRNMFVRKCGYSRR